VTAYEGRCHCGAIGFAYHTQQPPAAWNIRSCQCSFCRAHGALSTSDPAGTLTFRESPSLHRYRFAQRTADFLLCSTCGVYIGAAIETPRGRFGIVSVNALTPQPAGLVTPAPMNYDGETTQARTARREQRWTPLA
jgi:hypothetical protein